MAASSKGPQVFINFRGPNVRNRFVVFLEPILRAANINLFVDKDDVLSTDPANLMARIGESRVAVVIFSKAYTSSDWCLDELAMIKECMDRGSLRVIPIFYKHTTPSVVEELRGKFGDSFRVLKRKYLHEPERTRKWEEALESISKVKGMSLAKERNEREFIDSMVIEIQILLSQIALKGNPKIESSHQGGFLVPARRLEITHSGNPEKWAWSSIYDEPYRADIEIATMINVHTLVNINGDFHTMNLTSGTTYEVVFLVSLADSALGWKNPVTLMLKLVSDGSEKKEHDKASCLNDYIGDDWVEIPVGEFKAPPKKDDAKIFFSMHQYVDSDPKSGLVVKGVAVRPVE
ncbi:unnamed protein product [Thlaspi arvense]|uniref:TIR domain-containing protein n=1 Tax=Thlaspi arvense TaxID=13288 RepID=A0AAU9RT59_THLAR|nr:unnamed protein product [Thlaspi arvense]